MPVIQRISCAFYRLLRFFVESGRSTLFKPIFNTKTAQKNINLDTLENLISPYCSLPEQQAIVQEIETRLSVCDNIEQGIETNLEKAEALRQSILKKTFEGKLLNEKELAEVRGAEDWEPADVLLEKIKVEKTSK